MAAASIVVPLTLAASPASAAGGLDNPYVGANIYVNPDWSANAAANGGTKISNEPTFIWLDTMGAITGVDGKMGLAGYLDDALAKGKNMVQLVIYDLPNRDCAALASNGEIAGGTANEPAGLNTYETQYIDPIVSILSQSKYANLRIVNVIEPDSLPNLDTNVSSPGATVACQQAASTGEYINGVGYALNHLGALPNVYNYIDAGHHAWLGWSTNMGPFVQTAHQAATASGATVNDVAGFITNTANYSATVEPYFKITDTVGGQPIKSANWIQYNDYVDELPYAQALRTQMIAGGFNPNIGMLIDTGRNGWGGPNRPTHTSTSTDINTYVDQSRIDRRPSAGDWCNQNGAGIGERPQTAPDPGIDAFVWVKPPGESDGSDHLAGGTKGIDSMCDPAYGGNYRNNNSPTGALPNSPIAGQWFQTEFAMLLANAYPALCSTPADQAANNPGCGGTQPPTAPTNVQATATGSNVSVTWTASTGGTAPLTYQVYRVNSAGTSTAVGSSTASTSVTDSNVPAGTYTYTVKVTDSASLTNTSSPSPPVTVGGTGNPPTAPTNVHATASGSTVTVSWTASTGGTAPLKYQVTRTDSSGNTTAVGSSTQSTSATDSNVPAGTYTYTVKVTDSASQPQSATSSPSAPVTISGGPINDCTDPTTNPPNMWNTLKTTDGGYIFQQNQWGDQTKKQCVQFDPATGNWSITSASFNNTGGAPATYPSIYTGCHWGTCTTNQHGMPVQVSAINNATTSWSTTQPGGSNVYDVAYDIWFNSTKTTTGQPDGTELMIWLNKNGNIQPIGGSPAATNQSVAGHNWDVWQGTNSGQNAAGTGTVTWKVISYVLNPGGTSFSSLDVKAMISDAVARGQINPNNYMIDSEAGFEIWQGGTGLGSSGYSFAVNQTQGNPPSAPGNLRQTNVTSNSASLAWDASTGGTAPLNYQVYRDGVAVGQPTANRTFTDTGLSPSTTYSYTVKTIDAANLTSDASNALSVTTPPGGGLTAPTLSGSASGTSANLSWTASTGGTGTVTYQLLRGTTAVGSPTTGLTATDTGLAAGTYSYTVKATDGAGATATSNQVNVTIGGTGPAAPAFLRYTSVTASAVSLAWDASANTIDDPTVTYVVLRDGTQVGKVTVPSTRTYTDNTVAAGTSYSYTVEAVNASGTSSPSNAVTVTTPGACPPSGCGLPSPPSGLTATVSGSNVSLSWTASTTTGVSYQVLRGGTQVKTSTTTSATDSNVPAGTYSYTVVAVNSSGTSSPSNAVSVTIPPQGGGCTATYHIDSDWGTGFGATVTVTAGTSAIKGWKVTWTFNGGQQITNLWNGTQSGSGTVTVTNASYNGALGAGQSTTFGFNGAPGGAPAPSPITCTAS